MWFFPPCCPVQVLSCTLFASCIFIWTNKDDDDDDLFQASCPIWKKSRHKTDIKSVEKKRKKKNIKTHLNYTFSVSINTTELHAGPNFGTRPDPVKAWPDPTRPANFAKLTRIITARCVCTARTMLSQDVRLSVTRRYCVETAKHH